MRPRISGIGTGTAGATVWTRLVAALASWHLDGELAEGVDPRSRPALAARARTLIERRHRIADRVAAVVEHAADRPVTAFR